MKVKDFQRLMRLLCPFYPTYKIKGSMFFAAPFTHLFSGFYFEPSGFDALAFYVNAFVFPLYVPADDINFTFGKRLGGLSQRWELSEGEALDHLAARVRLSMDKEGLPFLKSAITPAELAHVAHKMASENNPYVQQAVGYSLIIAGRNAEAREVLSVLYSTLENITPNLDWHSDMMQRSLFLQELLDTNPSQAKLTLQQWERNTVKNLGLTSFWLSSV